MPGIGLAIDGAMQQAAQWGRQERMFAVLSVATRRRAARPTLPDVRTRARERKRTL
jgi:hypothetical protein